MTRRLFAWIALAVIGALAIFGALWSAFGPDKIVVTTAMLQDRINRALPREFKGVTVEQAAVTVEDGRVALRVDVHATALGQTVKADVSARGVPRYESDRGAIFFDADDVKVTDFALAGGNLAGRIDRLGEPVRQRVETTAGNLIATGIRTYLAERPVYQFRDDFKGYVFRAAITDIGTQADAVTISVSLVKLTTTVGASLAVIFLVLFFVVLLIRYPLLGT